MYNTHTRAQDLSSSTQSIEYSSRAKIRRRFDSGPPAGVAADVMVGAAVRALRGVEGRKHSPFIFTTSTEVWKHNPSQCDAHVVVARSYATTQYEQ